MKNKFSICRWLGLMFYYAMGWPVPKGEPEPQEPPPDWQKAAPCKHTKVFYRVANANDNVSVRMRAQIDAQATGDFTRHTASNGTIGFTNAYGELVVECPDCGETKIVACRHSLSNDWLCRSCMEVTLRRGPLNNLPNAPLVTSVKPPEA